MDSSISVIIRTFNSASTLPDVLEKLEPQPNDEIIIVDSGSSDQTLMIAKKEVRQVYDQTTWLQKKAMFAGNTNGLYRRELWLQHAFDETLPTAEDMEWMLWALHKGHTLGHAPDLAALYRNNGNLHMYRKGFNEIVMRGVMDKSTAVFSGSCSG
jgi:glycosyltransferase involved in cell wall biosynthesis